MLDALLWFVTQLALAPVNAARALAQPGAWLDWSDPEALMRFVYYGGSVELIFVALAAFVILTAVGVWRRGFLWALVRGLEGFHNGLGRVVAWVGLVMVLQQIVIVFAQRIFSQSSLTLGLGPAFTFDVSWWSEQLKLYNAMIVALCVAYTFVQGGHVRVDLVYAPLRHRAKRVVDMLGCLLFMMPLAVVLWIYSWYFLWRHLITPKVSASESLDQMLLKARALRWNVETYGFSPSGFNAYFLFKILLLAFAGLVFLQAVSFFWRSFLEWREGPEAEGRFLDRDPASEAIREAEAPRA
jgi:TRAP-type mannitol/chloroaromatic compound transport system permease small subunit